MKVHIDFDDREVAAALSRLAANRDLSPLMRDVGEELLNSTRERFSSATAPDGSDWAKLSDVTIARKKKNRDRILVEEGGATSLSGQLVYRAGTDEVEIGSTKVYASTHQFGADKGAFGTNAAGRPIPWGDIPARPFLGLSDADREAIEEIAADHLRHQIATSFGR